jgi:hypothetical protein
MTILHPCSLYEFDRYPVPLGYNGPGRDQRVDYMGKDKDYEAI